MAGDPSERTGSWRRGGCGRGGARGQWSLGNGGLRPRSGGQGGGRLPPGRVLRGCISSRGAAEGCHRQDAAVTMVDGGRGTGSGRSGGGVGGTQAHRSSWRGGVPRGVPRAGGRGPPPWDQALAGMGGGPSRLTAAQARRRSTGGEGSHRPSRGEAAGEGSRPPTAGAWSRRAHGADPPSGGGPRTTMAPWGHTEVPPPPAAAPLTTPMRGPMGGVPRRAGAPPTTPTREPRGGASGARSPPTVQTQVPRLGAVAFPPPPWTAHPPAVARPLRPMRGRTAHPLLTWAPGGVHAGVQGRAPGTGSGNPLGGGTAGARRATDGSAAGTAGARRAEVGAGHRGGPQTGVPPRGFPSSPPPPNSLQLPATPRMQQR